MSFNWVDGEMSQYLDPYDAYLSQRLTLKAPSHICEIGVYKGGWLINFLLNCQSTHALAIDPYPNLMNVKDQFLASTKVYGVDSRVLLKPNYDVKPKQGLDVVHIDGEHTEKAVLNDLNFAISNLNPGGVIIVDDVWHPLFPGIISGVMKIIHNSDLVPFLSTRNKMWLCKTLDYNSHFENGKKVLQDAGISFNTGISQGEIIIGTNEIHSYSINNAVKGHTQISVERIMKFNQLLILGLRNEPKFSRLKWLVAEVSPPIFHKTMRSLWLLFRIKAVDLLRRR